ncbi:MAG: hypothetical protein V3U46_04770, partial [Acidimicrobiia bacterium]
CLVRATAVGKDDAAHAPGGAEEDGIGQLRDLPAIALAVTVHCGYGWEMVEQTRTWNRVGFDAEGVGPRVPGPGVGVDDAARHLDADR